MRPTKHSPASTLWMREGYARSARVSIATHNVLGGAAVRLYSYNLCYAFLSSAAYRTFNAKVSNSSKTEDSLSSTLSSLSVD